MTLIFQIPDELLPEGKEERRKSHEQPHQFLRSVSLSSAPFIGQLCKPGPLLEQGVQREVGRLKVCIE